MKKLLRNLCLKLLRWIDGPFDSKHGTDQTISEDASLILERLRELNKDVCAELSEFTNKWVIHHIWMTDGVVEEWIGGRCYGLTVTDALRQVWSEMLKRQELGWRIPTGVVGLRRYHLWRGDLETGYWDWTGWKTKG